MSDDDWRRLYRPHFDERYDELFPYHTDDDGNRISKPLWQLNKAEVLTAISLSRLVINCAPDDATMKEACAKYFRLRDAISAFGARMIRDLRMEDAPTPDLEQMLERWWPD